MNLDDMIKKSASDLDDIMTSIESVKGQQFAKVLALHINYTTLVTLSHMLDNDEYDKDLHKMLQKTAILCATSSLEYLSELCKFKDADIEDVIKWGDRLRNQIQNNFNQLKGTE